MCLFAACIPPFPARPLTRPAQRRRTLELPPDAADAECAAREREWLRPLDSASLHARAQDFKAEAGELQDYQYPSGRTGKAYRTDFTAATSPRAYARHGPVRLWRVGAVDRFNHKKADVGKRRQAVLFLKLVASPAAAR